MTTTTPLQILPHPKRGTMEIGTERILPVFAQLRAADGASDENPVITVTGTDGSEDRHGTPINPRGWDFKPFERNPVALWSHGTVDNWPAVGAIQGIRGVGGAWDFDSAMLIKQWRHLDVNMPAFIWEVYRDFGMGAVSVSFIPKKWEDYESKNIPSFFAEGVRYLEQELTEISFVNVPSNRNALAKGLERYRALGKGDGVARMLGYDVSPIIIRSADLTKGTMTKTEAFRARLAETLKRYCCEPYREPKPDVTDATQQAAEVTLMTDMAAALLAVIEVGFTGWRNSKETLQRGNYAAQVTNAMWEIEGLLWRAKEWYGAELAIDLPAYGVDELEPIVSAAAPDVVVRAIRSARRHRLSADERSAVRAKVSALLRCCGCYAYDEAKPNLPTDEAKRAEEIALLREFAEQAMQMVELGMRIWTTAETERLRNDGASFVYGGMSHYDSAVRNLSEWYGEEVEAVPNVEMADVERAFAAHKHDRAGAVFAKKNLDKIKQIGTLAEELLAAATKPTADDVPEQERRLRALAAQHQRMEGPFDYASTQVNLEGETADAVLALVATITDEALAEKGRETAPHVTVKYGIDPSVDIAVLRDVIENSDSAKEMAMRGGATMTLGAVAMFEAYEYDVLYVSVDSPDLVLLNSIISEAVPVTDTHPEYIPHVTLAYVKKGEGAKYVGDETLAGTEITFDAIVFSDTEGNQTEIPLAGEGVPEPTQDRGLLKIRIKDTGGVTRDQVTTSQPIRVIAPDAARGRAADDPSNQRPLYVRLMSE